MFASKVAAEVIGTVNFRDADFTTDVGVKLSGISFFPETGGLDLFSGGDSLSLHII